jgi:hypothetical protein
MAYKKPMLPVMKAIMPLMENVSAFSAEFHGNKAWPQFYERYAAQLSGFPGIWTFCAVAGYSFTAAERELKLTAGEDYEYIEAVTDFAALVMTKAMEGDERIDIQTEKWLKPLAVEAINKNKLGDALPAKAKTLHGNYAIGAWDNDGGEDALPMYLEHDGNWCAYDHGHQLEDGDLRVFESVDAASDFYEKFLSADKDKDELVCVLFFDEKQFPRVAKELHRGDEFATKVGLKK